VTLLVLDFDGTMTDAEAEGAPFRRGYLDDLAALVGRKAGDPEILALADQVDAELVQSPGEHPFTWDGKIVAPASVDPYLRIVPIAGRVFDRFGAFQVPDERGRLLRSVLYKYNYEKTRPVFRPGARAALAALRGRDVHVVTNSGTAHVARKIETLDEGTGEAAWLASRVHGDAGKFVVDESWDDVPSELRIPGLTRPVLVRRRSYHDVLRRLCGGRWSDLVVVGDIFELDLALPLVLGARVGLVTSPFTPPYERAYVGSHPRGRVLDGLGDIADFAFGAARSADAP
jgi:hypothetical protein